MNLEDLMSIIPLGYESEDYDTIGGYLTGEFDHFPNQGETYVDSNGAILKVEKVRKNRITKILIRLPEQIAKEVDEESLPDSDEDEEPGMLSTPASQKVSQGPSKPAQK